MGCIVGQVISSARGDGKERSDELLTRAGFQGKWGVQVGVVIFESVILQAVLKLLLCS